MLTRQKCLLYMIEKAGRPVTHLELTKWAFLLAREMPSQGGTSFYDFLPYKLGPFSFMLYHEVDDLVQNGYLRNDKTGERETWSRVQDVEAATSDIPGGLRADASRVVERFATKTSEELLDYVYDKFPWYTANSNRKKLRKRPVSSCAVHTIGYEQCSVDQLLDTLMRQGIAQIIDVRQNPIARRYGFHKSTLLRLASNVDIGYVHFPELGIPSELRQDLRDERAYASLFDEYVKNILPRQQGAVAKVSDLMSQKPSVLLCMEADPAKCHRTRLADAVSSRTKLPVKNLRGATCEPILS